MKSQTQHIGNYSNVFDYSPFGAPLDGRTVENIFHQEEITDTSTVLKTIYVLEETFDVASDWQDVASYSQISYPSGKMEVKNPSSFMRLIGAKKGFTTGTGQHAVSFEISSLPAGMNLCRSPIGVIMGAQYNKTSDTLVGTGSYQIQSVSPHYVVVEIRNENNALVLKDSTNSTGTYSYAFSAPQGKEYTVSFHNKSMCANLGYQIDNVFISYDTLEVVTGNSIIVTDTLFIINNDFENAVIEPNGAGVKIDGWTHYSPSTTLSVEPHNGSDWLKVVSTNGTHGAHQGFSVEPGETYTFEIDLHRPSGMNNVINIVIWKNTGPSGAYTLHVLNTDGSNTFNYTATSSNIYIQIRQAGTYYLDNIKMYRTYQDTVFVGGFDVDMVYAYGYNTQMRVDEIAGKGNHYTAPYWEYDPRVVHRWNRDPMAFKYPWQSPYVINNNNPLFYTDPYGLEGEEPEKTGPRGAEQEDGSFNGYLDLPEVTVSAESRDKTEAQVKEKLRVIQELSNPDWGDRYRRSLTAFKLAHKYVGEYGYSSYDFTRDYRKFGWCDYDPECYKMSVQEQRELRQEWGYNWEEFALFVHNVALYSLLGADFLMMESSLIASPFYSSRVAAKTGSSLVDDVAKHAKSWLGKDYKVITNKAGDNIFMSKDGLRKMRFDIKNPHGDKPHLHLEIFKNGKWRDAIPGNHRIYPK